MQSKYQTTHGNITRSIPDQKKTTEFTPTSHHLSTPDKYGACLVVDVCFDAHFLRQERRVDQAGHCLALLGVLQQPLHHGGQDHLPSRVRLYVRGLATIGSKTYLHHLR